jgi:predicted negative regulator of RcsB-dependent stress response
MAKIDKYTAPRQQQVVAAQDALAGIPTAEDRIHGVEDWYKTNGKMVNGIGIGILALILGYFAYNNFWKGPNNTKANDAIFRAQTYFGLDSIKWALEGEGNNLGFIKIANKYGSTPAGNLAKYYAGICYLKLGDFKNAEKFLKDFDGKGTMVANVAKGALGDALMEQGKTDDAIKNYLDASNDDDNMLLSPIYMERAGIAYEMQNKSSEAAKIYRELKEKFPNSTQGQAMDKNLSRLGDFNP